MSKILLTQDQLREITKKLAEEKLLTQKEVINEGYGDEYYEMECDVDFDYYRSGLNFKGNEVNDIIGSKIRVKYYIDIEARSWGIKDISIYGIEGPSEYEIEIDYYTNDGNDDETETITLNLDWENIEKEEESDHGVICVGQTVTLTIENDESGSLKCTKITVPIYTL